MSAVARSLDDLDRLAFRLSRTIRTQYPQLLAQGFTLGDLEERLLPYREVRREMADGGADAFESALLRLIAGDRAYVVADPALQNACRQALAFPSPTLAMVRAWATSTLRLAQTPSASGGGAAHGSGPHTAPRPVTTEHELFPAPSGVPNGTPGMTPATAPAAAAAPLKARVTAPRGINTSGPVPAVGRSCCRFCDNTLPQGRTVTFCPYCGMDLTKRRCPACSTELDVTWRYCVTCGREG